MEILDIIFVPIISIVALFILTKMMGYRQIAQLSMYDYIIGITFGSIAGEFISDGMKSFPRAMTGLIIYTIFTVVLSRITQKSPRSRKIVDGKAVIIYENDTIYDKELEKAKMDIDEFLMQCRIAGYFNLYDLEMIVLETSGDFSFLPKEKNRPSQVGDLGIKIQDVSQPMILVKEGHVYTDNLVKINKDPLWLENTVKNAGLNMNDIILMYHEDNTNIQIFSTNNKKRKYE